MLFYFIFLRAIQSKPKEKTSTQTHNKEFACNTCEKTPISKSNLLKYESKLNQKMCQCSICQLTPRDRIRLIKHAKLNLPVCRICHLHFAINYSNNICDVCYIIF